MFITLFSYLSTAAWKQKLWDGNISLLECVNMSGSKFWRRKSLQPLPHCFVLQCVGGWLPCYCTHLGSWEQRRWWSGRGTPWFGSFCTFCSRRPGLHGREWLKEGCSVEENHSWLHSWNWINVIICTLLLYSLNLQQYARVTSWWVTQRSTLSEKYIFAKRSIFLTLKEVQIAQKAHFPTKLFMNYPIFGH